MSTRLSFYFAFSILFTLSAISSSPADVKTTHIENTPTPLVEKRPTKTIQAKTIQYADSPATSVADRNTPDDQAVDGSAHLSTLLTAQSTQAANEQGNVSFEKVVSADDEPRPDREFGLKSQTTLRFLKRDTTKGEDNLVLPLYQYLQLDYEDTELGGWSAHAYGWGRSDLTDSAYFEDPGQ